MNKEMTVAKYVKKVTMLSAPRKTKFQPSTSVEGFNFDFKRIDTRDLKVGDVVFIAKLVPTLKSEPFLWSIHQIKLPVSRYYFDRYTNETSSKAKRLLLADVLNHPQTWFGYGTYIVEMCKKSNK